MQQTQNVFRPKARIIHTIGKELIANPNIALLELIKNSYDADAKSVNINNYMEGTIRHIVISDDGHGMTKDDIENKWLVLATANKKQKTISPEGRILLGNKGIGRYASALLGNQLKITSYTQDEIVTLELDWNQFTEDKFLDEINISITTQPNNQNPTGTTIEIINTTSDNLFSDINEEKLERDLSVLIDTEHEFCISYQDVIMQSYQEKYPEVIKELYHFRMQGTIKDDGTIQATFTIKQDDIIMETKEFNSSDFVAVSDLSKIGTVNFDIKVFNRDKWGKQDLANIANVHKIDAILNKLYGVAIYRNGVSLQPYGTTDFDWLLLDKERVQSPSGRLGNNQVYGIINIDSEENSGLIENSSREGLRYNDAFKSFFEKMRYIVQIMGQERATYRKGSPPNNQTVVEKISSELDDVIMLKKIMTPEIKEYLDAKKIPESEQDDLILRIQLPTVDKMEEAKNIYIQEIHNLEIYALLGKLVSSVSHELATPILNIRSARKIVNDEESQLIEEIRDRINRKLTISIDSLSNLKEMIKPLSESKKKLEEHDISKVIDEILDTYKKSNQYNHIEFSAQLPTTTIKCFEADIYAILHNLIDNSKYWCDKKKISPKIDIYIKENTNNIELHYQDNGPGASPKIIDRMFEIGITLKPNGSGLGLPIITSLLNRIAGTIEYVPGEIGAHFCIKIPMNKE